MKNLHPNIRSHLNPVTGCSTGRGSSRFRNGSINLFGVAIDFVWDNKENSWQCSFPHIVDDKTLTGALDKLYNVLCGTCDNFCAYEVFDEEAEFKFSDFQKSSIARDENRRPIFYDEAGEVWVLAQGCNIAIKLDRSNSDFAYDWILTPEARAFAPTDVVHFYDDWM